MMTTTQFLVPFIGACVTLFSIGFFAIWAEFNSSAKQYDYTRYPHVKVEPKLIPRRTATTNYRWSQA